MKLLKTIGAILFVCLLAVVFGLVIAGGMALLALGDFARSLGRRFSFRARGQHLTPGVTVLPVRYTGPFLVMDDEGFVEPPTSAEPHLVAVTSDGSIVSSAARTPLVSGLCGAAETIPEGLLHMLEFPVDAEALQRLQGNQDGLPAEVRGGGDNVIFLSDFRRRPNG